LGKRRIVVGNEKVIVKAGLTLPADIEHQYALHRKAGNTVTMVCIDGVCRGMLAIADVTRGEAKESIGKLRALGIHVLMLTGDNESVAKRIGGELGIDDVRANMTPEGKLTTLGLLGKEGIIAMVGDGVNDAPALARANVGIAMGTGGTAVAVEAANIIILTDQLDRIPEMITLARKTVSVINLDMLIWFVTNALGVFLVLSGAIGPALAAFYNFATDFLPLLNSVRLFKQQKPRT
jgi:P-type E1-E2 ATPase